MKVEAHAFFSESLFEASEESMWQQLAAAASYEGVIGAYLMPDAHSGYGVPVGCVVVTEDTIIQAGSGYDISCGVLYMRVPASPQNTWRTATKRERFVTQVETRVATGVGSRRPARMPRFSHKKGDEILRFGARPSVCRRTCASVSSSRFPRTLELDRIERAYEKVVPQLGSVGRR